MSRPIHIIEEQRSSLEAAIAAGHRDEVVMTALVMQLYAVEEELIQARPSTYAQMAVKARLLLQKLEDDSIDCLIPALIECMEGDLENVEHEVEREFTRMGRKARSPARSQPTRWSSRGQAAFVV